MKVPVIKGNSTINPTSISFDAAKGKETMTENRQVKRAVRRFAEAQSMSYTDAQAILLASREEFEDLLEPVKPKTIPSTPWYEVGLGAIIASEQTFAASTSFNYNIVENHSLLITGHPRVRGECMDVFRNVLASNPRWSVKTVAGGVRQKIADFTAIEDLYQTRMKELKNVQQIQTSIPGWFLKFDFKPVVVFIEDLGLWGPEYVYENDEQRVAHRRVMEITELITRLGSAVGIFLIIADSFESTRSIFLDGSRIHFGPFETVEQEAMFSPDGRRWEILNPRSAAFRKMNSNRNHRSQLFEFRP